MSTLDLTPDPLWETTEASSVTFVSVNNGGWAVMYPEIQFGYLPGIPHKSTWGRSSVRFHGWLRCRL